MLLLSWVELYIKYILHTNLYLGVFSLFGWRKVFWKFGAPGCGRWGNFGLSGLFGTKVGVFLLLLNWGPLGLNFGLSDFSWKLQKRKKEIMRLLISFFGHFRGLVSIWSFKGPLWFYLYRKNVLLIVQKTIPLESFVKKELYMEQVSEYGKRPQEN